MEQATKPGGVSRYTMSITAMAMLTVCAVFSLRNLPNMAVYGWSIIFYLVAASIGFFVPSALVSAELASAYPENGGVFVWVKEAFGPKWGFLAIFMEWVQNLPWYPAILTFVAAALAYAFDPSLAENRWFIFIMIQITLWGCTLANFQGMRLSVFLSNAGVIAGTLIPGVVIIGLVGFYFLEGKPAQIPFDGGAALLPELHNPAQWMMLAGMMLSFSGMEMSSVHVTRMKDPSRSFPQAIFLATAIIVVLSILGSLAIALVVPPEQLTLSAGVCQAFEDVLKALNVGWMLPVMCVLLAFGALSGAVTWINGPSAGLLEVAQEGYLPSYWRYKNKHGMQTRIFVAQAVFGSLISISILVVPTISNAFWLFNCLCAQLYMIMYLLMFAAAIRLRYSQPNLARPSKVPGGNFGMWLVSGAAFCVAAIALICGFIPPEEVIDAGFGAAAGYVFFLGAGIAFFIFLPLWFFKRYQREKAMALAAQNSEELVKKAS